MGKKSPRGSLTYWPSWVSQSPKYSGYLVKDTSQSGATILDNENNIIDILDKSASFEFKRPLMSKFYDTMDIQMDVEYSAYISYGVYNNENDANTSKAKGDAQKGTSRPLFQTMMISSDPVVFSGSNWIKSATATLVSVLIVMQY